MKTQPLAKLMVQLRTFSSCKLKEEIDLLAAKEHVQVAELIAHLAEVSRRSLHLELAYRSLFDYCVKRLGLSEGCTALRIQVSRFCRRHPLILDALAEGRISLTVAGKLAPHLTDENREGLIADCDGMTKREVEEYLVRLAPKPAVSSGARQRTAPAPAPSLTPAPAVATRLDPPNQPPSTPCVSRHDSIPPADPQIASPQASSPPRGASPKPSSAEPCQPDLYNYRFSGPKAFKDKLQRVAEVGGMGDGLRNMLEVLDRSLDAYLSAHDPVIRQQRREKRKAQQRARTEKVAAEPVAAEPAAADDTQDKVERSRFIPAALRDRLLILSGHRCEYRSSDDASGSKRRCSERSRLEVDHIMPFSLGGRSEEYNLRVFCVAHNRFHGDRCFGAEFMNQKIEAARRERGERRADDECRPRPDEVSSPDRVGESVPVYFAGGFAVPHRCSQMLRPHSRLGPRRGELITPNRRTQTTYDCFRGG